MDGDDPNSNHPSRKAGLFPPRPEEIDNTPPPLPNAANREPDAAQDLFDMFQSIRKKSSNAVNNLGFSDTGFWSTIGNWFGPQNLWKWLVTSVVIVAAITAYFKQQPKTETTAEVTATQSVTSETGVRNPASSKDKAPTHQSLSSQLKKYETPPPSFSSLTRRINSNPPPQVQPQENNDPPPAPEYNNDPPPENAALPDAAQASANENEPSAASETVPPTPNDSNTEHDHTAAQPEQSQENSGPDIQTQN